MEPPPIALPLGIVGLYLRTRLEDTPGFRALENAGDVAEAGKGAEMTEETAGAPLKQLSKTRPGPPKLPLLSDMFAVVGGGLPIETGRLRKGAAIRNRHRGAINPSNSREEGPAFPFSSLRLVKH